MDRLKFVWYAVSYSVVWAIMAMCGEPSFGQPRDQARLAVDVVHLKNQKQIRGFVLNSDGTDEVQIAVEKSWLEKDDPATFLKALESSKRFAVQARLKLKERIEGLLNAPEPIDDQPAGQPKVRKGVFNLFLRKELERIDSEMELPPDELYQFVILKFKSTSLLRVNIASDVNRKLAVWSWSERLADVETRKPSSLVDELKAKKIDPTSTPPDLSDRFYETEEGDEQWTKRLAIVTHRLDKSIEFQGSGDVMLLVAPGQPPDLAGVMGQMMQSQVNTLIQELTGTSKIPARLAIEESDWAKIAISKAEKMHASYFRATKVQTNPMSDSSTVQSAFLVVQATGKWTIAWQSTSEQTSAEQKPDAIKRIAEDPQIKTIQTHFESMGGGAELLDKAIRTGAATMTAQTIVNDNFIQFSDKYLKRLNQPPMQPLNKIQQPDKKP